jgi:tetratricopeptide (TPR) repeat protein
MALSVLAGCATNGRVKAAPVADEPSVVTEPSVAKLEDGREGFIITEVPTMDEASRRDFDRAVAMLKDQDYGQAIDLLEKVIERNEYGLLCRKTGRFAEARAIYEKAIARFPEYYPLHRNLGILCDLYLNDPACAFEHYEIYSNARPEDAQVKLWIEDLRARLGRN